MRIKSTKLALIKPYSDNEPQLSCKWLISEFYSVTSLTV